jgi:acyl-lipid omega-6 desaturase (Delta-12 desaturase)
MCVFMAVTLTSPGRRIIPILADLPLRAGHSVRNRTEAGTPIAQPAQVNNSIPDPLARFARASLPRALWQLANTLPPFLAAWGLTAWGYMNGWNYGWVLLAAVPAAGLYVRLFIIQHDCSHGSFFRSARANRWLGAVLGVITLFPFAYWKKTHAVHHATSGNLDKRELGDIRTLTVREYRARSPWVRLCYRLYRSMPVMLGLGPVSQFVFKHRLPVGMPLKWKKEWRSVVLNDLALLAVAVLLGVKLSWTVVLAVHIPVVAIAGALGVWLFYVQHSFEEGYWTRGVEWSPRRAAVEGSSFYDLPAVLRWITCNIGYHHIHHLSPRIPNYHLRAAHEATPMTGIRRLDLRASLACARMKLWDEDLGRMVGFPGRALQPIDRA